MWIECAVSFVPVPATIVARSPTASSAERTRSTRSGSVSVGASPVVPATTSPSEPLSTRKAESRWNASKSISPRSSNGVAIAVRTLPSIADDRSGDGRHQRGFASRGVESRIRAPMRILVCRPQTPFVRGGAEIFTDTLAAELRARGHEVELVSLPWVTWPNESLVRSAMLWRLLDLGSGTEAMADMVIATKFPSYLVRHPNKVVWLVHQLRQAYELHGTDLGQFSDSDEDRVILEGIPALDCEALGEARRLFATSSNVAERLRRSTGLDAE